MHCQSLSSSVLCICTNSSEYIRTYKVVCDVYFVYRASVTGCENDIEARSYNHCCSGKAICFTQHECVCVVLGI